MKIRITPNDKGNPPGKLADAELHFTHGPLEGLKLIGFAIWERRGSPGSLNVTFPARQYTVNGERRSYALLRPIIDSTQQYRIRDLIIEAYQEYQERQIQADANEEQIGEHFHTPTIAADSAPEPEQTKAAEPTQAPTLIHAFSTGRYTTARCGASNDADQDAPATEDPTQVTCPACLQQLQEAERQTKATPPAPIAFDF